MFIEVIILSLIIGFIRGGKISRFKGVNFRRMWILILALIIQYFLITMNFVEELSSFESVFKFTRELSIISYILLFVGILINLRYRSLWIVLSGSIMNFLVMILNGWKRPIILEGLELLGLEDFGFLLEQGKLPLYTPLVEKTKLAVLGDIMLVSKPYPFPHVFSFGDFIICLGLFTLIQEIMMLEDKKTGSMVQFDFMGR
ncbi:DUF5317 domain-containing protein [Anaerosalibacter massiliensis]|uniref:DUF5317 domain-containing protein n=1 Tax=Anaerosalibacter massiliensis TaxID=1347392 RepID=A0A9X2S5N7_9FIRM|nr:DUF5317 domain-containing protein [Anaerosalibacter massiliensis]MCR2044775.1 DUF5317 domain-containing protein [Anaerosalibacter massiliensis]